LGESVNDADLIIGIKISSTDFGNKAIMNHNRFSQQKKS